ncbi:Putative beta-barrel porin-2, OmpL-like. bbp2 [Hymenobacter gelipurpurascens]|uniref:Putative beta-barrel porin-2, OmpL-like. bbp2 n=1 Tax=Hymenobacter gelipurpurascens TaxID=89968 RepID=A0A212UHD2_9BACT|nr:porin [Hymenobacter gelipurpurascens]SNC77573.1 Putative beta-barrel porin-2, OmpL-like. bbp2 [Hymenobacter gelipurpurascens]
MTHASHLTGLKIRIAALLLAVGGTSPVLAQPTPTTDPALAVPPPAPVQATPTPANPLTFYGFADAYYGYDFRNDNTQNRPGFLYSHDRQNEFTVNNVILGMRYQDDNVRGALGLHAGSYVTANYAAEDPVFRHIYEAYAGFRPFSKAWLDVGIFSSHIGFESAISKDNWTLTRSLMAENSPYYQAGARLTYEVGPKLTLTGLVLNGWQNLRENNQAKALGTQIQWKPTDKLLLNSSTFYGQEQPQDSTGRRRYFHDFYVSYAATDRLSLALVFDVGKQQAPRPANSTGEKYDTWHAGSAFVRYQLADKWTTALRGEYYQAERGVIINSYTPAVDAPNAIIRGGSLGLDYAPTDNVLVRLEGWVLNAGDKVFGEDGGAARSTYANLTSSVAISF